VYAAPEGRGAWLALATSAERTRAASHRLRAEGDSWLIAIKQINLLDSDQAHQNLSIIF